MNIDVIEDRIKGLIYGNCLGDAVGLTTEFKFKSDVNPSDYKFPYSDSIRGYQVCDWTDDSDQMILIMEMLTKFELKITPDLATAFAKRLYEWVHHGFPELGDKCGMGLGGSTVAVVNHEKFLEDPFNASYEVWNNSGRKLAPNGSLMRTSILSAMPDLSLVETASVNLGRITHIDPRCVSSCVIFNYILHELIYNPPCDASDCDAILVSAIKMGQKYIQMNTNPQTKPTETETTPDYYIDSRFKTREEELAWYLKTTWMSQTAINELELDSAKTNGATIGYVFKTFGCAIYALRVIKVSLKENLIPSFKKIIECIVKEAGDADTNASVVGAMIGSYLGFSKLPADWVESLPNREWLDQKINAFLVELRKSTPDLDKPDLQTETQIV